MQRALRLLFMPAVVLALAGCQTGLPPAGYTPDPKLKTESPRQLEDRVWRACLISQERAGTTGEAASKGCRCYAKGTLGAFSPDETKYFRDNGYFNDSGQKKGLEQLAACGLKRP